MRASLSAGLVLFAFSAQAQEPPSFNAEQMQAMMEQAQAMEACISKIDPDELEAFQLRVEAMGKEVDALCAAGDKATALSKAIAFGRETVQAPVFKNFQSCVGPLSALMPQLAWTALDAAESSGEDVCGYRQQQLQQQR